MPSMNNQVLTTKKDLLLGLEIEGMFDYELVKLKPKADKNGMFLGDFIAKDDKLTDWRVGGDGSLRETRNDFQRPRLLEIFNVTPMNRHDLMKEVLKFRDSFGDRELSEVMAFNKSAGLHIHFSKGDLRFSDKTLFPVLKKVREMCFERIKNATLSCKKKPIIDHYLRNYAKESQEGKNGFEYLNGGEFNRHERYLEFNFASENERDRGMEWRSPNLLYVKTWDDFFVLINIYLDCVEEFVRLVEETKQYEFNAMIEVEITEQTINEKVQSFKQGDVNIKLLEDGENYQGFYFECENNAYFQMQNESERCGNCGLSYSDCREVGCSRRGHNFVECNECGEDARNCSCDTCSNCGYNNEGDCECFSCDDCGELGFRDDVYTDDGGNEYCENCYYENEHDEGEE